MVADGVTLLVAVGFPVLAIGLGVWAFWDATRRGHAEWAPFVAVAVGGAFLAGSVPGLVALALSTDPVAQGFPTALRILPGVGVLGGYLALR